MPVDILYMTLLVPPEKVCVETHDTFVSCEKVCIEEVDTFSIVPLDIHDSFSIVEKGMSKLTILLYHAERYVSENSILLVP